MESPMTCAKCAKCAPTYSRRTLWSGARQVRQLLGGYGGRERADLGAADE
jgi:hypothetical protein